MPIALYVLTVASFAIGTTEFVIMGLLPQVSVDLSIDIPTAGLLVTAYAMGVVVGGPSLAILTARLPRRPTLLWLSILFMAGNLACAAAPSYGWLCVARILTAFSHGTFLGVAGSVACQLVPPQRHARANGLIFSGITLANVLGVPAGIAIGQAYGWRATFVAVAALALLATTALYRLLPNVPRLAQGHPSREFVVFGDVRVILSVLLSIANSASLLCLMTFLTPYLTDVTHFLPEQTSWILLLFGGGLTLGTSVGGRFADRNLMLTILVGIVCSMGMLVLLPMAGTAKNMTVVMLFLWGMFAFGLCPMLHTLVMRNAYDAPTLASTFNHSAFNLGNALGAWIGSMALSHGQALAQLPYTCLALAFVALVLAWALRKMDTHRPASGRPDVTAAVVFH